MVRVPIAPPMIATVGEYSLCEGGIFLHNEGHMIDAADVSADVKKQLFAALTTDEQRAKYAKLLGMQGGIAQSLRRLFRRGD